MATSYWLVSYEIIKETEHRRVTGFNTCSSWTTKEPVRNTVAIEDSEAKLVTNQDPYPVILHTQSITAKEYKESKHG